MNLTGPKCNFCHSNTCDGDTELNVTVWRDWECCCGVKWSWSWQEWKERYSSNLPEAIPQPLTGSAALWIITAYCNETGLSWLDNLNCFISSSEYFLLCMILNDFHAQLDLNCLYAPCLAASLCVSRIIKKKEKQFLDLKGYGTFMFSPKIANTAFEWIYH